MGNYKINKALYKKRKQCFQPCHCNDSTLLVFRSLKDIVDVGAVPTHTTILQETKAPNSTENANISITVPVPLLRRSSWWFQVVMYSLFLLSSQSVATILGKNSKWMATLVLNAGFPVLLPLLFFLPSETDHSLAKHPSKKQPSQLVLASIYISLGILLVADSMLYAIGLLYLPVSTFTLICATQLAFNALFSFFLNSQKFTPFIINSLVLLTISSILLVFIPDDSSDSSTHKNRYALGCLCTIGASAGYSLILSLTQLAFQKILKTENFRLVLDMIIYTSAVATSVIVIGLFSSGEWKNLSSEMREFKIGSVSYVMILVWTAVSWQVYNIGTIGLIYKVSSLFSNVISTLGLPIVPVLAVFIFNEKMSGLKAVSMVLAIWGFVSYMYQHYLDDLKDRLKSADHDQVP
ncbi:putative purine permease [Heracleum sosnowskyi]|uniref:Probable purine permease n=1 Tax=Heracleum sosnowskyi TaxID=360622 RepID=A0AAD8I4A9_9APIA|nr:putative purine permease [Heracleum sosnowskyi]